ncbi:MAG: hypothetical protein LBH22_02420 [Bacteroidales bacterium]|jgi:hypothetical protein|nr:hypothetical protein [Bacteroidales bacterium]
MTQQNLKQPYNRKNWETWLGDIFAKQMEYETQPEKVDIDKENVKSIHRFATVKLADGRNLAVLDIETRSGVQIARNRVGLRNLVEKFIDHARYHGILAFYHSEDKTQTEYRLSFISSEPTIKEDGTFEIQSTAPKRFSYVLGENEKTKTPADRLKSIANKGGTATLEDVKIAFSVESLNEDFYKIIAKHFYQLVGATEGKGAKAIKHERVLQLPSINADDSRSKQIYQEFAVRLIGRTVFCWFLKMKKPKSGKSLLPEQLLSSKAVENYKNYYHFILEKLFFQTLNTPMDKRIQDLPDGSEQIPFLNGGLFEPQTEDYYLPNKTTGISSHINTLKISDEWFLNFFTSLEQYNFTIDENSIADVEISVDPEMLGRIFENLLAEIDPDSGESARNTTGSFYTPREIVDYMAIESIASYIFNQLKSKNKTLTIEQSDLSILFRLDDEIEEKSKIAKYKIDILESLDSLKILDPACGSGAFPMGVLQKIVIALQKLDPNAEWWKNKQVEKIENKALRNLVKQKLEQTTVEYARKIGIIQNSLYGVDIQQVATEISKLRCFLTLIVDESIDDAKPNRGVEPLPNLEFKFVTADTLLQLPQEKDFGGLFNSNDDLQELQKIRLEYLQSYGNEKNELKERFLKLQKQIGKQQFRNVSGANPESRAFKISAWNPFSHNKTDWFDPEWMFGLKDGFDIVIGNPPYGGTKISEDVCKALAIQSKDPYGAFIARFLVNNNRNTPLKDGGVLAFIVSDTFMTIKSHLPLRKQMMDNYIHKIIRVHPDTFRATVNTAIIICERHHSKELKADHICQMVDMTNISIHDNYSRFAEILHQTEGASFVKERQAIFNAEYAIYYYPQQLIKSNSNLPFFVASPKLFALMNDGNDSTNKPKTEIKKVSGKKVEVRTICLNGKEIELVKLSDIAEVKQGLATGDNNSYIFQNPDARGNYKNINEYDDFLLTDADLEKIRSDETLRLEVINKGISKDNPKSKRYFSGRYIVPYDKGGESDAEGGWMPNYHVPATYFMDWSEWAIDRMKTLTTRERNKLDGKDGGNERLCSRFQNANSYFIKGITFSWTGVYAPTFRFSFACPYDHGSSNMFSSLDLQEIISILVSRLIKWQSRNIINHTVNFGIDDVKDYIVPAEIPKIINQKVNKIIKNQKTIDRYDYASHEQIEIDKLVYEAYGLSPEDVKDVENWYARRYTKLSDAQKRNLRELGKSDDYLELYGYK